MRAVSPQHLPPPRPHRPRSVPFMTVVIVKLFLCAPRTFDRRIVILHETIVHKLDRQCRLADTCTSSNQGQKKSRSSRDGRTDDEKRGGVSASFSLLPYPSLHFSDGLFRGSVTCNGSGYSPPLPMTTSLYSRKNWNKTNKENGVPKWRRATISSPYRPIEQTKVRNICLPDR
jgi:hypothetical protein